MFRSIKKSLVKSVALCGVAVVAVTADAASPKKTSEVNLDYVKDKESPKKKRTGKAETRISRNEAFLIATETRLLREINKAIKYLTRTAKRMPKKSQARLEMREKLVNLRLEAATYYAKREMRRYDKAWNRWDRNGRKGKEPQLDDSNSKRQWRILARDAQKLLREYPRSKNADVTMFNMGLSYDFLGQKKKSARVFSKLISKYPNSKKAGDAYFALGDFYFDRSDFRNAMNNYKNALRFKQSKAYAWALFKLGWCNYNLQNYRPALNYWKKAVSNANQSGKKGLALKDEALRDMVYAFAELKQIEPAIAYYRRHGGEKYIGDFLNLLSQTFSDQGKYGAAIRVLKRYQQVEPYGEGAPDTQKEIISLNYELNRLEKVWTELARFPKLYGAKSPWGRRMKRKNRKRFLEVQQEIKDQILYYAKLTHKNAQKDDNPRAYQEAMKGYKLFLKNYPRAKEVAEVKFNMADIQYFQKKYRRAGKLYLEIALMGKKKAVIYDPKSGKPDNIHRDSALYMLDGFSLDFDPEYKKMLKRKPDFDKQPKPISVRAKNFIKACSYFKKWYPKDRGNIKKCDTITAQIFYRSNNRKMAMKYLWLIAKKYPGSDEGKDAVENLIPLYGDDKKGLAKAATKLLAIPAYAKGKLGKKLRSLKRGTQIEVAKKIRNKCKRANRYRELYKEKPQAEDAPNLIYNSAVDFLDCGNVGEAISSYMIVLKRHPKSKGAKEALLQVAKLNERRVEMGAAAGFYEKYAERYPKDKRAIGAMAKACEIKAALESSGAISACLKFAKADKQAAKSVILRLMRAAYTSRNNGKLNQYVRIYTTKFNLSPAEKIVAYSMIYNATDGRGGSARQAANQIMSTYKKAGNSLEGEALRSVGQLAFQKVKDEVHKIKKVKLKGGTVDTLVASIQKKAGVVSQVTQAYQSVLNVQDAYWGVAALYQIGRANELLADDLKTPPPIKGAKYEEVVAQLAPQEKAARQEARKYFDQALKSVSQYDVYNIWAAKALSGLARNSGKDVAFDDMIVTPDFLGAEVPTSISNAVSQGAGI